MSDVILRTNRLTKTFSGFAAVSGVDLSVRRGTIHALIGPNGAGKTTCFNMLTKFLQPTSGSIVFNGSDITRDRPARVARQGIVRSFQICAVFPHMTSLENVRLGLQRVTGTSYQFWQTQTCLRRLEDRARSLLNEVGLSRFADQKAADLSYGHKRALELATTLAQDPELMLLDEPTQGMGHEDVGQVAALIKRVASGRTVLMVEHNMNVVSTIADTITVLQRGSILAEGTYEEISRNASVVEAYMGSPATRRHRARA
jgi:branched-chain amino acid transport system ATP-binding protein